MDAKIGFFDKKLAYTSKIIKIRSVAIEKSADKNWYYTNENHFYLIFISVIPIFVS